MIELKELENFKVVCKKCGNDATIEMRESTSYRNDTCYTYLEAICHHCHIRENLK